MRIVGFEFRRTTDAVVNASSRARRVPLSRDAGQNAGAAGERTGATSPIAAKFAGVAREPERKDSLNAARISSRLVADSSKHPPDIVVEASHDHPRTDFHPPVVGRFARRLSVAEARRSRGETIDGWRSRRPL
jgi:hypothetical protein